ncbi:unnamed protein product [Cutaneotrichosporon oleaginosum]
MRPHSRIGSVDERGERSERTVARGPQSSGPRTLGRGPAPGMGGLHMAQSASASSVASAVSAASGQRQQPKQQRERHVHAGFGKQGAETLASALECRGQRDRCGALQYPCAEDAARKTQFGSDVLGNTAACTANSEQPPAPEPLEWLMRCRSPADSASDLEAL